MGIKVKICGIKTIPQLDATIKGNAYMVGLMFYDKSPRYINIKVAKKLSKHAGSKIKKVGVVANMNYLKIKEILEKVNLDFLQFHGEETPEFLNNIKKEFKVKIIKSVKIINKNDLKILNTYKKVSDFLLLDSKNIKKNGRYKPLSKSKKINFNLIKNLSNKKHLILSGALNNNNLEKITKFTKMGFVDVSSSLENVSGTKSIKKITNFLKIASKLKV